jgi:hypothetical protein
MPKEIRNSKSEFLHCAVGPQPNRSERINFLLPSTGRGIEGEGWKRILESEDGIDRLPRSAPPSRWRDPLLKSSLAPALATNPGKNRTSNIERPTSNVCRNAGHWMLGVGCLQPVRGFNARKVSEKSLPIERRGRSGPRASKLFVSVSTTASPTQTFRDIVTLISDLLIVCFNRRPLPTSFGL